MLAFALKNLFSRPVRSLLALSGLTVAIAGMVGLFSVARGIESTVTQTFNKIPGLLVMQPGAPIPLFSRIPTAWGQELAAIPGVHAVTTEVWVRAHLINGKPTISPPRFLFGMDPEQAGNLEHSVYRDSLESGRFLNSSDRHSNHAVISRAIADEFHKNVGDTLQVDSHLLEIVGIYNAHSLLLDVAIVFDIDQVRQMSRIGPDTASCFYVELDNPSDQERMVETIKDHFRGRELPPWQPTAMLALDSSTGTLNNPVETFIKQIGSLLSGKSQPDDSPQRYTRQRTPTGTPSPDTKPDTNTPPGTNTATAATATSDDSAPQVDQPEVAGSDRQATTEPAATSPELPIEVRTASDWADQFKRFSADLELFLTIMTSIGVVISVLGIVNTMLMSVTERFIEFGILKANGWSNLHVLLLIGYESALLGVSGGVLGSTLGWWATLLINARWPDRIHLYASPGLLLFALLFSTLLGVIGGLYPAWWAARMLPMEAIRRG